MQNCIKKKICTNYIVEFIAKLKYGTPMSDYRPPTVCLLYVYIYVCLSVFDFLSACISLSLFIALLRTVCPCFSENNV